MTRIARIATVLVLLLAGVSTPATAQFAAFCVGSSELSDATVTYLLSVEPTGGGQLVGTGTRIQTNAQFSASSPVRVSGLVDGTRVSLGLFEFRSFLGAPILSTLAFDTAGGPVTGNVCNRLGCRPVDFQVPCPPR